MRLYLATITMLVTGFGAPSNSGAVPPPAEQYTANCVNPTYASDQFVCKDADLLAQDRTLAELLSRNPELAQRQGTDFFEAQTAWFRRRSLCAMQDEHAACLRQAYADRLRQLTVVGRLHAASGAVWRCVGFPPGAGPVLAELREEQLLLMNETMAVVGTATLIKNSDSWKPYVSAKRSGASVRLATINGLKAKCRK